MVALATVFAVMLVSLLIARVATIAFTLTGLSREAARFQARSALSGTGFTTTEAESVVNHPVRRQIAMVLMLVGSAGLVTVIASLMLSFAGTRSAQADLDARDYGALLHLADRYAVGEILVRPDDWVAGRSLADLELREEGVVVLGITLRDGTWLGSPTFETRIEQDHRLVVYAPSGRLAELDRRRRGPAGDAAHGSAVADHRSLTLKVERAEPGRPPDR